MGFDAFGIHSENFAIKKGIHHLFLFPPQVVRENNLTFPVVIGRKLTAKSELSVNFASFYVKG